MHRYPGIHRHGKLAGQHPDQPWLARRQRGLAHADAKSGADRAQLGQVAVGAKGQALARTR